MFEDRVFETSDIDMSTYFYKLNVDFKLLTNKNIYFKKNHNHTT
jgi:hypothetical protein